MILTQQHTLPTDYEDYLTNRQKYQKELAELSETLSIKTQERLKNEGIKSETKWLFDNLNEKEKFVSLIESGKEEEFFDIIKKRYQGGLSNEVFDSAHMRGYAKDQIGDLYGYFTSKKGFRTKEIDEYLEKRLYELGMTAEQITRYLCSGKIRRLIELYTIEDDIHNEQEKQEFINISLDGVPFR